MVFTYTFVMLPNMHVCCVLSIHTAENSIRAVVGGESFSQLLRCIKIQNVASVAVKPIFSQ